MPGRRTRRVIETSWVVWRGTSNLARKLPGVEVEQARASLHWSCDKLRTCKLRSREEARSPAGWGGNSIIRHQA
jgi:hypothetical protein